MSAFRGLGALTHAYLLQAMRSRTALFWNLAFPLLWLFVFGFIFGRGTPESATLLMPGLFTITIISGSFFGVSYLLVNERESAILRRYRVTPVTVTTVVLANALRSLVTLSVALAVQATVARLVFHITIAGSLVALALMMLLGAMAFVPLGLIVGSAAQDMKSAPAISNLIFFPMVFVSGAAVPAFMLPEWVQGISRLLPATYLVEALTGIIVRGESLADLAAPAAVLVLSAVVGAALNSMLFRWESSQPVDKRALLLVVFGLTLLFTCAAFFAPKLRMTRPPDSLRPAPAAAEQPRVPSTGAG